MRRLTNAALLPWRAFGAFALGAVFVGTVATTLLTRGPFAWHVQQPTFWQGSLEALALAAIVFAALQSTRLSWPWRVALLALPVALYLRRHHVDAVLLVAWLYVEGLLALGACLRRACRSDEPEDWLRNAIAGIALMSLLLWLAQLAGFGLPRTQRLLAVLALLPAIVFWRRGLLAPKLLRAAFALDHAGIRAWAAVLIALPLVFFARTNTVSDFDSVWYGLRPYQVLVGDRSVFEPLGFASPVYYFPKLYEVLLLPLSAMREDSVAQGATVLFGALLALLAGRMLRRLEVPLAMTLAGAAAIWTIPALGAASLGAKPDVLVALLIVAMIWFGWNVAEGRRGDIAWVFACAGLAVSSKLLAIPYVAAAVLGALFASWRARGPGVAGIQRDDAVVIGMAAIVGILVCYRTFVLTGLPTIGPEQLVALWRWLGMELRSPVGTLHWVRPQVWSDLPSIFVGWIADPSRLSHLQITWPSNLWIYLPLLVVAFPASETRFPRVPRLLWLVPAVGLLLLIGVGFMNRGGDGNYFIAPVVLASVAGLALAWRRCERDPLRWALSGALVLFVTFHFAYLFVSAGWGLGTRSWDLEFSLPNRDAPIRDAALLDRFELEGVAHWLRGQGGRMRVVGITPDLAGYRLAARYEELGDVAISHGSARDLGDMQRLLACGKVVSLLLPQDPAQTVHTRAAMALVDWARAQPAASDLYRDELWRLIDLRGRLPRCE